MVEKLEGKSDSTVWDNFILRQKEDTFLQWELKVTIFYILASMKLSSDKSVIFQLELFRDLEN